MSIKATIEEINVFNLTYVGSLKKKQFWRKWAFSIGRTELSKNQATNSDLRVFTAILGNIKDCSFRIDLEISLDI